MGHKCDCGNYVKNDDYECCYECNEMKREEENETVRVAHFGISARTDKAIQIRTDDGFIAERIWLPVKLVESESEKFVWIPKWLADERGLDYV